jgi:hypothetical protein
MLDGYHFGWAVWTIMAFETAVKVCGTTWNLYQ